MPMFCGKPCWTGKTGTTVIFSTHDMSVAEKMCHFIFMIYKGNKVLGRHSRVHSGLHYQKTTPSMCTHGGHSLDPQNPRCEKVTDFGRLESAWLPILCDPQAVLATHHEKWSWSHFELTRPFPCATSTVTHRQPRCRRLDTARSEKEATGAHACNNCSGYEEDYKAAVKTKAFLIGLLDDALDVQIGGCLVSDHVSPDDKAT